MTALNIKVQDYTLLHECLQMFNKVFIPDAPFHVNSHIAQLFHLETKV